MNFYSACVRMACVAAIIPATLATACGSLGSGSPQAISTVVLAPERAIEYPTDKWEAFASDAPADLSLVNGNTFGLYDWRMPADAGLAQGNFGVALMDECVVTLAPGIMSDPDSFSVMVESRFGNIVSDPRIVRSVDELQQVIDENRPNCQ